MPAWDERQRILLAAGAALFVLAAALVMFLPHDPPGPQTAVTRRTTYVGSVNASVDAPATWRVDLEVPPGATEIFVSVAWKDPIELDVQAIAPNGTVIDAMLSEHESLAILDVGSPQRGLWAVTVRSKASQTFTVTADVTA